MKDETAGKNSSKTNTLIQPSPLEGMSLHSFIKVKGYSIGIEHRMERAINGDESEKTLPQWEAIYTQAMSRVTK
jgi:hypothetical protein